jgi:hypothetical protein
MARSAPETMFKEAFLCGLGLVVDISGSHYVNSQPVPASRDQRIAQYWQNVGKSLRAGIEAERPVVDEARRRQLQLNLGS